MLVDMDQLDMPLGQTPSIHKMHTSRGQRDDSSFIEQKLLDMTFAHWVSLQRSVFLQLRSVVRTNASLKWFVSRIRYYCTSIDG